MCGIQIRHRRPVHHFPRTCSAGNVFNTIAWNDIGMIWCQWYFQYELSSFQPSSCLKWILSMMKGTRKRNIMSLYVYCQRTLQDWSFEWMCLGSSMLSNNWGTQTCAQVRQPVPNTIIIISGCSGQNLELFPQYFMYIYSWSHNVFLNN